MFAEASIDATRIEVVLYVPLGHKATCFLGKAQTPHSMEVPNRTDGDGLNLRLVGRQSKIK